MGTDIHPVVQRKTSSGWKDIPLPYGKVEDGLCNRNYELFAILANVRNGHGVAGIVTGEPVRPITKDRGLPVDFTQDDDVDIGDHSYTWLTLEELLNFNWKDTKVSIGVVALDEFNKWDRHSRPLVYSGCVYGQNIVTISETDAHEGNIPRGKEVFVRITWRESFESKCKLFVENTIPWLATLGKPQDVRIVMGFDS